MTLELSTRRRGAGCPLFVGLLALLLGAAGLFIALFRDPLQPRFVFRNPTREPLEGYDINTPTAMEKTVVQARLNADVRAMAELERRLNQKYQESIDTLTTTELDFKDDKPKKGEGHSGDYKVLLVNFKAAGEEKKEILAYEHNSKSGLWEKVPDSSKILEKITNKDQLKQIAEFSREAKK